MVVHDCCPFTHSSLVKPFSSRRQDVVLVFDLIVTTNRHVPPLSSGQSARRPSLDESHRVCVRRVAVSFGHGARRGRHAVVKLFCRHPPRRKRGLGGNARGAGAFVGIR